ncbi:hypothetical protein [Salipiger aestuarii]|uniref:Uncharacterized protein n=1 Tax=Salipiger aestuarii TaxID=568098 RepID=A0A327Y7C7_9RHOB|nr:hypothetical protein [Salipiger aestuarii]EIE52119.1 hypothetical protein C357_05316 [Citreicella sp. 357]RAK16983.1 hypothetical protein ATI53_101770 [Salipiger aestuarii]
MTLYLLGLCVGLVIMAPLIMLALYAGTLGRKGAAAPSPAHDFQPGLRVVAGADAR